MRALRGVWIAAAMAALGCAAPEPPREPILIVLADVENQTGEPVLDNSLNLAFRVGLEQSRHVYVLPSAQAREALTELGHPPDTPIDRDLGIEICRRENAGALVTARIVKGSDAVYSLSGAVVDPQSGTSLYSSPIFPAADTGGILEALEKTVRELRSELARLEVRRPEPPAEVEATPEEAPAVEVVGEGVISTDRNETFPAEDPVDGSLWFSVYDDSFDAQTILFARRTESGWAAPEVSPFSGEWGDRAPRFSPDGATLYFTAMAATTSISAASTASRGRSPRTSAQRSTQTSTNTAPRCQLTGATSTSRVTEAVPPTSTVCLSPRSWATAPGDTRRARVTWHRSERLATYDGLAWEKNPLLPCATHESASRTRHLPPANHLLDRSM